MNILKFCLICAVCLVYGFSTTSNAAIYVPENIKLFTQDASYKSGTSQDVAILSSNDLSKIGMLYDYGVAREIKNGFITSYEIMSTKTVVANDQVKVPVVIPNITADYASSTYVVYLKSYIKNDPESENFFVTNKFTITPNAAPFIQIKNINLLKSDGSRASLSEGPTIYDPLMTSEVLLSTSTAIEVTFESNTDTILKPTIAFTKLRSGDFKTEHTANDILIRKGINYILIPLPTFSYNPGVYVGRLDFQNELIPSLVDLQYIVAGESATVGQVTYTAEKVFTFAVFGTPVDLAGIPKQDANEIHSVETVFLNNGKNVFSTTTVVNFASSTFDIMLPQRVKNVDTIQVKVISTVSGKMLYSGEKKIDFTTESGYRYMYLFYIAFIVLLLLFAYKRHVIRFMITLLLFLSLIVGHNAMAFWDPNVSPYRTAWANNLYVTEGYSNPVVMYFNKNIPQTTFTCGQPLEFMFQVAYVQCSNTVAGLQVGFSTTSQAIANATQVSVTNNQTGAGLVVNRLEAITSGHYFYTNVTTFMQYTGGIVRDNTSTLYGAISSTGADTVYFDPGWTTYAIPLTVSQCTACTNAPDTSNVPNFKAWDRNYYYSAADQKLYYRDAPIGADMNSPAACGIDMCSETQVAESEFPDGESWKPMPPTSSSNSSRYWCGPMDISCVCTGRDRVCNNNTTGTTSTSINHPSCVLRAYCSVSYFGSNAGTVTFDAYNKLGSLAFDPDENPVVRESIAIGNELITRTVIDTFDNRQAEASCLLEYGGGIYYGNTGSSTIVRFYANPQVVNAGSKCMFGWETNNMSECSIDSVAYATNTVPGSLDSFQVSTVADRNVTKTLKCYGIVEDGPAPLHSTTTTCFVNPKIQEN